MIDSIDININKSYRGNLILENDEFIFKYISKQKDDFVSLSMPIRSKDYTSIQLFPIFQMHLPEGYLLSLIKKHFSKIMKIDDFGLLKLMAPNIKGRINYQHKQILQNKDNLTLEHLLFPKNDKLFNDLVSRFALSSSISGVQPKILAQIQNKATLSFDEYIVKSWGDEYPNLALNEYYCMKIIQKANIAVPEFYISNDNKLFIMKRFDIKDDGSYLGFEDMCVLQAKQTDEKYEGTYEAIVKSIKTFVSVKNKKSSLEQFFKMIIINNLVKNGDAHLKNFAILYDDIDDIKLSPAYDVVCTTAYIKNDIQALNLMGSKKWWSKKYLIKFGVESCGLSLKNSNHLYLECQDAFLDIKLEIEERIKTEEDKNIVDFLEKLF